MQLHLRLPAIGVGPMFPSDEACRERLVDVQWPDGVWCPKCRSKTVGYMMARRTFYCEICKHQFTAISGTVLRHSRVSIRKWFLAAELLIQHNSKNPELNYPTGHDLKDVLGISYAAAHALKKKVLDDLSFPEVGLVGDCVLTKQPEPLPMYIPKVGRRHFQWVRDRFEKSLGWEPYDDETLVLMADELFKKR